MPGKTASPQGKGPMPYTTAHELNFLRRLGRFSSSLKPRRALLQNYKEAMSVRKNWGQIDPDAVRKFVTRELAEL